MLLLQNDTGKYVRYEYGQDLFGHLYLDISSGNREFCQSKINYHFYEQASFIRVLDNNLMAKESHNYSIHPAQEISI